MSDKKNKRKTVTKQLTMGYRVQTKRTIISAVIALLITLLLNWEVIAASIPWGKGPSLYLTLEERIPTYTQEVIDDFVEKRRYVPNYDADIYISLEAEKVGIGNFIKFGIKVVDKGILELQRPYFYLFIVNLQGQVVSSFPGIGQLTILSKLPPWSTEKHTTVTDCLRVESNGNPYYIPRKTLIDGYGRYIYTKKRETYLHNPSEIGFQFLINDDPSMVGEWRIFIFLYDENYVDRFGAALDSNNFVSFQKTTFAVTTKTPPSLSLEDSLKLITSFVVFFFTFFVTYLGIYSEVEKRKEKLYKAWIKIKEHVVFIISIIIIAVVSIAYILWLK